MPDRAERFHKVDRNLEGDAREPFARDRDRLLYSSAFRRLAGVTQVAQAAEGFHNRLTHSLKVAQFGRRLAERLAGEQPDEAQAVGGIDPDVVETACLAHDLGHPPFGHVAELELDEQVTKLAGTPDGYEGNAQSLRIVTRLSVRHKAHAGLNLTRASLNALLKYPWPRGAGGKERKKWGYYFSETDQFRFARAPNAADRIRCPEAELMNWADDVTYAVHDVEDFYRAAIVPLDRILQPSTDRDAYVEGLAKDGWGGKTADAEVAARLLEEIGDLAPAEVKRPFEGSRLQRAALNHFSAQLITKYSTAVTLDPSKAMPVQINAEAAQEVDILQGLMRRYVFTSPALVGQQYGQRLIIKKLFEVFHDAAQRRSKDRGIVPLPFRETVDEIDAEHLDDEDDKRQRARLAADIVATLTEQQAVTYYQRLMGIAPGSVLDLIVR